MAKGERGTSKPYLRGNIWWIKYYVNGKPEFESSESAKKKDAVDLLLRRRTEVASGKLIDRDATIGQLLDLYLADQRARKRSSLGDAEANVREHLRPAFGRLTASELTPNHWMRFIEQKRIAGYAEASINRYRSSLVRAFTLGMENKPRLVTEMPKLLKVEEDNVREGFLEHPDYVRLRDLLAVHQKTILVIGYHLGMRAGEIVDLRWEQVDWYANLIRLEKRQTKGKQARVAPLYGELRSWLDMEYARRGDCAYLVNWRGGTIGDYDGGWKRACQDAGLPDLLVHDLRRTAVRNMVRAGIPEKAAMRISGHKTRAIFDRYNITDERDIQSAGQRMENYLEEMAQALLDRDNSQSSDKVVTVDQKSVLGSKPETLTVQ